MRILGSTLLVLATLGLAACGGSSDDSSSTTPPPEPAPKPSQAGGAEAEGESIFVANCASCHTLSAAGAAGAIGPNLDELKPSEAQVKTIVTNGGNGMPSFSSSLDSSQIDAVAKYVSSVAGS
jgi:mono/diheme cytochrome c family protein